MKPKSTLLPFLALAASSMMAVSSASAATYNWTQTATGNQDWNTAGNWLGGTASDIFVSDAGNELKFFDTTAAASLPNGDQTIIDVPNTLSLNTLTLNGKGRNTSAGSTLTIGTSASTWTIGDGLTSTVNLIATDWSNDRDIRYIVAANLTLNQATTTFTGDGTSARGFIFSGNITDGVFDYGITKSGTSFLTFSGTNTYSGATQVTGGTLALGNAGALSSNSVLTLNGGMLELNGFDFNRSLGTVGSNQFQITGGISGFGARGGDVVVTVNGDASTELVWGTATFNPTKLALNRAEYHAESSGLSGYSPAGVLTLANKIDLNGTTRTVMVNANKALFSGDIRDSTLGSAGLTKEGSGTLVLTGNNTYNGNTTLSAGTLSVGVASNFGSGSSGLVMNGGTLQIRGTTLSSISGLGHTVTFNNNAKGFDIQNAAHTFTVDTALSGTTFTKSGAGTLVIKNNTTLSGATTANGGGTLVLDYSTPNNGSKLADTQALNLNGSNLVLRGGSHAEAVGSIALAAYTGNSISRDGSSAATIANAGTLSAGDMSNLTISEAGIVSTTTANHASGIQSLGRITVGYNFATKDGSNLLQAYSGYTNYNAGTASGGDYAVVNQLTGGGNIAGSLASYALRIVNSGDSNVLNLGANNLKVEDSGTFLYAGADGTDNNFTINGSGRLWGRNTNRDVQINVHTGTLTVNALMGHGGRGLWKSGVGTLVAGGSNDYDAQTYVMQGVLRLANNNGAGDATGGIFVQAGAALELSQTTAPTPANIAVGAEALTIDGAGISNGGALRNHTGNNSYAGAITIGASGARINADASSTLTLTGGITTTLTQDVTFGGAGDTTVSTTAITGSGSVIKDGNGTLTLTGANTYTGATTITGGSLALSGSGSIANSSTITINSSTSLNVTELIGDFTVGASQSLGGSGTLTATGKTVIASGTLTPGNSPGTLTQDGGVLQLGVGGDLNWQVYDANAPAGIGGYDTVSLINGATLDLSALSAGNTYNINLWSLSAIGPDVNGNAIDFNNALNQAWTLFSTGTAITNFDTSKFTINTGAFNGTSGFTNTLNGSFNVALGDSNTDLVLTYTAIPEPRAALLGGLGMLLLLRRRRR